MSDGGQRGYTLLLQKFWMAAGSAGIRLRRVLPISSAAFCKARRKLRWTFLRALIRRSATRFRRRFGDTNSWKERQILAIDGVKLSLRRSRKLTRSFGKTRGAGRPMITVCALVDVLTRVPVDVTFGPYASGERTLVWDLLDSVAAGSVLVLDRGYPSYRLLAELVARRIDFVVRVPCRGTFLAVTEFLRQPANHGRITLTRTKRSQGGVALPVRIQRIRQGKEVIVLLTSLSAQTASRKEVRQLYRRRWTIESCFKVLKVDGFGQDAFHAATADGVRQEICARLLFTSLTQELMAHAAQAFGKSLSDLGPKGAHAALGQTELLLLVSLGGRRARRRIRSLLFLIAAFGAETRTGRSFPRRSFKPSLRWDPHGKTSKRGH